jgi:hypothetical protein
MRQEDKNTGTRRGEEKTERETDKETRTMNNNNLRDR